MASAELALAALLALAGAPAAAHPPAWTPEASPEEAPPPPPRSRHGRDAWDGFHRDYRGRGDASSRWLDMLLDSEGRDAKPYIRYFARLIREAGRDPELRRMWGAYARRWREDPDGWRGVGQGSWESKDYPSSVAAYSRALSLGARFPDVYYGRGLAADAAGDHELANRDARTVLEASPGDPRAFALAKLTEGRPSTVRFDPVSGAPEQPSSRPAPPPSAPPAAAAAPEAHAPPTGSAVMAADARRRLNLGDPLGAIKSALAAAQADPKDAEARNLLATAYERVGRHPEAEAAATEALSIAPDSVPALNTRAWARAGQGRFDDALADARRVLGLMPDGAFGWAVQARALGGLGRRDEMLDSLARAARLDPRFSELRSAAARLPKDSDTELLFAGIGAGQAAAPAPARAPRTGRFLTLLAFSMAGGLLVGLGLLHALSPSWRSRVTERVQGAKAPSLEGLEVRRLVASGGMGVVYEAWDPALRRRLALKRLRGEIRADPKERARLLSEARTVAALEHPNIVRIHSVREDGGELCLLFEFAEGRTLRERVAEDGPLPPAKALAAAEGLCAGLGHAHGRGFVHRDVKPENVMLGPEGAKLMDFGLARPPRPGTSSTTVWGSPPFMAPEAEDGAATPAADLYALAATLYMALTGKPPFHGSPGAMSRAKGAGDFVPPSRARKGLPPGLDDFMARALSPDPKRRPADAAAFLAGFRKSLS